MIVAQIQADLKENPLKEGETINIIGYSGGGQLAINVMEAMDGQISNVVLIGTPVVEIWSSTTDVHMIISSTDILSWNVGWGYNSYYFGAVGHTEYFNEKNIDALAEKVNDIIA